MKRTPSLHLALVLGLLSAGFGAGTWISGVRTLSSEASEGPRESALRISEAYQAISKQVAPSVVSVTAYKWRESSRFGRRRRQLQQGSGVIVREDGIVVTNNHVVRDPDTFEVAEELVVQLADGRELIAHVRGTDTETDLAILEIRGDGFAVSPIATGEPAVGEWVLAMGHPFGYGLTVTTGVVSGKGRNDLRIATYEDFLQTDAAINPGNSGGPLVNLYGEIVGINTAIGTRASGSQGIGFAIPSHMVRDVLKGILRDGHMRRGFLGISTRDNAQSAFGYDGESRVAVESVEPDSPAKKAGFQRGDVIVAIKGDEILRRNELMHVIAGIDPGTRVMIDVWRHGRELRVPVTLGERPAIE